jgi:hypothetical protein
MSGRNLQNAQATLAPQAGDDQSVVAPYVPCKANNAPRLSVSVYCDTGGRKYVPARVKAAKASAAALTANGAANTGLADFSYVAPGTYTITVESILAPADKDYFVPASATATVTLAPGDKQTVEIAVERKNVVTPKLEGEYLAVLLERKLSQHQAATDPKKFLADPTYVELSISETNNAYKHTAGAKLTVAPANVEFYLDEKCRDADKLNASGDITDAQLRSKQKVWLRGKTAGKITLKLELKDAGDTKIRNEDAVELKMGVVELKMKLHKPDLPGIKALRVNPDVDPISTYHTELKDLDLPDPVEMTDKEKVVTGRVLHVQKKQHFSRAKLVIKRYTQDHWPAGCDDYEIKFLTDYAGEAVAIHGKEWDKDLKKEIKIKVSDLKAKDHEYWLEGKAATPVDSDVRYELALDRADGGLTKTTKRNGDWARFKVVQINEVKVDYTTPANSATAWNATDKRFYINFQADPAGRTVTIGAQLSTRVKDVEIHFMLAPDKDNQKKANWGVDLPDTWAWRTVPAALKEKDKNARTEFLHLSAKTNDQGYAKVDLTLSRFGGDKFRPAAYLAEDSHLAKYVHGNSDLEKKKPVLATYTVTVWRKIWYQLTRPQGLALPTPNLTLGAYKKVMTEVVLDQTLDLTAGNAPARTFYPESMFKVKSNSATQVANIGSENKNGVAGLFVAKTDQPVKRHLMVCLYQCDRKGTKSGTSEPIEAAAAGTWVDIDVDASFYVLDPPLQGGSFISQLYWYRQSAPGVHHAIAAAGNARVPVPRKSRGHIQVQVPAIAPAPTAADPVTIFAECFTAKGFLGESFGTRHTLAVYDKDDEKDFNDTITHEFGHSFNQTPRAGTQPGSPSIPNHPTMADRGQGNHCQVDKGTALLSGETKFICVMYDSGPMEWGAHKFCKTCHPYLLVENFHRP